MVRLIVFLLVGTAAAAQEPDFTFGAVADCQYCDVKGKGRRYRLSPKKLAECVKAYNRKDLKFVVHLGDFIDRDFKSFDVVGPIFSRLKAPRRHVLGNHDFSVADDKKLLVPAKMGLRSRYYDFAAPGWRFIVVDGNDVSLYAHPKDSPKHAAAEAYYKTLDGSPPKWNGAVGKTQIEWIHATLKKAAIAKERVVFFCHFPIYPKNAHNLWNADEVRSTVESSPNVVAWINGHNHAGNYGQEKGIHYLTLKGMVDTEKTAYSVVKVSATRMDVVGYGRQKDRTMKVRPLKLER